MNRDLKNALIIGGILVGLLMVVSAVWGGFSGWQDGGWGMMGPGMMGGIGGGITGIIGIIILALVIWGIVLFVRGVASPGGGVSSGQGDSALEILKRRYARGEIGKEEFEEKKKNLT